MTIPLPLQEALGDSITSGTFIDTKFWVPSKRGSKSGRVGELKALFVNGHVAAHVPRLASLLGEREAKENLRARFPADRGPYTDGYDYEYDSDLEEEDEEDILDDEPAAPPQSVTEKPRNSSDAVGTENSGAKGDEALDVVSFSDLDSESLFSESSDTKSVVEIPSPAHVGKVVVIEDVAFITFQAMLRYLYTGEIEFAPWGSKERREARSLEKISDSYGILKPSPKSIYRLADKYDIPELKELALRQIQQDISQCDIAEELFSKYTSWYPELRELELKQLARALLSSDSGHALWVLKLKRKIKSYTKGRLPHAEHVLPALYKLMEGDGPIEETPLPAATSFDQPVTGGDWDGLKRALTNSLTSGTFLDSQFYVVESRSSAGSPIRPIYFCSSVGGSFPSKLVAYSSKLKVRRTPLPRYADGHDSDIGDEKPDPVGLTECHPCSKCVREDTAPADSPTEPALLLKSGAAKTWNAIFLYVYTRQVTFSAIGSQDESSKAKENQVTSSPDRGDAPRDSGGSSIPPPGAVVVEPCSPKSIYCLADKVGLIGLCDIAFEDIRSKLDENNIVQELFSPFTADHKRIREMEHELFRSKLNHLVDIALFSKAIRSSSSGKNPHHTAVMGLIFERSIQERRKRLSTKAKGALPRDPMPQPNRSSEVLDVSIPHVQPSVPVPVTTTAPAPAPTLVPQPPLLLSPFIANLTRSIQTAVERETSPDSPTLSNHAAMNGGRRRNVPPADTKGVWRGVGLCSACGVNHTRNHFCSGGYT